MFCKDGGFLPLSSYLLGLNGRIAATCVTALAEVIQQNSGKSTPSCFLIRDVFSLTSTSVSVTHTNMEDGYVPSPQVLPNSTKDRPVNHEMVFTEVIWTNVD